MKSKPIRFKLTDMQNSPIAGSFYEPELQKVIKPPKILVDKILDEKLINDVLHYYVKWKYYPEKFNSYVPVSALF